MILKKVKITNYRQLQNVELDMQDSLTVLAGPNNSGKNVYPEEIEGYLQNIPYVSEVVVYAVRNESGEETALCAEIYPNEELLAGKSVEERNTMIKNAVEELNKTLPSYKKVLKIKLRSTEFEKTTSKKIRRVGLQTEENMAPSESGSTGKTE